MAKPVQCAEHHGSMLTATDYCRRWTMRLWASILATRESIDETIRNHSPSKDSPDMPTARALDLHAPTIVSEAEASPHAEIWRQSMNREFHGLLQASTCAPV